MKTIVFTKIKQVGRAAFEKALNLNYYICIHLVGDHHTKQHREIVGIGIMAFGVGITKLALFTSAGWVHFVGDLVGYALHGIGLTPFAEGVNAVKNVSLKVCETDPADEPVLQSAGEVETELEIENVGA